MAETGTAEASSADYQRLCWTMRCAERGRDYELIGHGIVGKYCYFHTREWANRAESTATNAAASRQINAVVDSRVPVGGATQ
jgi:hypothetical protein